MRFAPFYHRFNHRIKRPAILGNLVFVANIPFRMGLANDDFIDFQLAQLACERAGGNLVQFATGMLIHMKAENQASVRSHLAEVGRFADTGQVLRAIGIYRDVVFKDNGIWKFQERVFELRQEIN